MNTITPFKIIQTPTLIAMLYESPVGQTFRQVFTDGRELPTGSDVEPAFLGYFLGRWENDTLVVETTGFRDGGWLDTAKGRPHSSALRLTERFRRINTGRMELTMTVDDPRAYVKPWSVRIGVHLLPDTKLLEGFCESQQRTMEHLSTPDENLAIPPIEKLTDRRGDEPQIVVAS